MKENAINPIALAGTHSSVVSVDLGTEIARLRKQNTGPSGRSSKTLVNYPDFRIVLMVMKSNTKFAVHKSSGRISVEVLDGHIQSHILGKLVDLPAGHVLALDREVLHDVEALEESAFLLTIALPADAQQS